MNKSIERKIKLSRIYTLELVSRMNLLKKDTVNGGLIMESKDEENAEKFLIWFCNCLGYDEVELEK